MLALVALGTIVACAEYVPPSTRDGSGGASSNTGGSGASGGTSGSGTGSGGSVSGNGGSVSGSGGSVSGSGGTGSGGEGAGGSGETGGSAGTSGGGGSAGAAGSGGGGACSDPACAALKSALIHRYTFDGAGDVVTDSVGTAHGTAEGATLDDSGALTLAGTTSDEYVDLPNGLISGLDSVTLEIWFTWSGGSAWQRLFDFGSSDGAEGAQGDGETYLFLTPKAVDGDGAMRVAFSDSGNQNETLVTAAAAAPAGTLTHVTVVVDAAGGELALYQGTTLAGSEVFTGLLSSLDDVNAWLGRSQYSADPEFAGTLHEFRIYDAALGAAEIAFSDEAGPDPAFLSP